jgi:hypothetical protein
LIDRIEGVTRDDVGGLGASFLTAARPVTASVGPKGVSETLQAAVTDSPVRASVH